MLRTFLAVPIEGLDCDVADLYCIEESAVFNTSCFVGYRGSSAKKPTHVNNNGDLLLSRRHEVDRSLPVNDDED